MRLVRFFIIVVLGIFAAFGLYDQRRPIACKLLSGSEFHKVGERTYVDKGLSSSALSERIEALENARSRNEAVFGPLISKPNILLTSNTQTALTYGTNEFGTTHKSPLGQCVVVGPRGMNVDVMAHELMHAEVAERLGLWATIMHLPIWLDEGIALMVDYRERYDPARIDLPDDAAEHVKTLETYAAFYSGEDVVENYQAARLAAGEIFDRIDTSELYARLERVRGGESFAEVFGY